MYVNLNKDSITQNGRENILTELSKAASIIRTTDEKCWALYNNTFNPGDYTYLTSIGGFDLPAKMRHIPKQRPYIDWLAGRQTDRPFPFTVTAVDKKALKRKYEERARFFADQSYDRFMEVFNSIAQGMQQIEQKKSELQQKLQQKPQNDQEVQEQNEIRQQMPVIEQKLQEIQQHLESMQVINDKNLDDVKRMQRYTNKDIVEEVAQKAMKAYRQRLSIKNKSVQNFISSAVTGKERYYVDYRPGDTDPIFRALVGYDVFYQAVDNVEWIQDLDWCGFTEKMSPQDVISEFRLEGNDKLRIEEGNFSISYAGQSNGFVATPDGKAIDPGAVGDVALSTGASGYAQGVDVKRLWWVAERNIEYVQWVNKYRPGRYFTHFVKEGEKTKYIDEKYYRYQETRDKDLKKVTGGRWINKDDKKDDSFDYKDVKTYDSRKGDPGPGKRVYYDRYRGVVIDRDILIAEKDPIQPRSIDNISKVKLPIVGPTFNNITFQPYSLIWATKDIQATINLVTYHRELMLGVAGTKSFLMDKSQKPEDVSDAEWRYRQKMGNIEIETARKGVSRPASFNQFAVMDMSLSASIQYLEKMLESLDNQMGLIMGISRPAMGQVVNTDQVGTFQMSQQSTLLVTEILFAKHDEIERQALSMLMNICRQYLWDTDTILSYWNDNNEEEIVRIPANLLKMNDFDILLERSTLEERRLNELKQYALQNYSKGTLPFHQFVRMYPVESLKQLEKMSVHFAEEGQRIQAEMQNADKQKMSDLKKEEYQLKTDMQLAIQQQSEKLQEMSIQIDQQRLAFEKEIQSRELALKELIEKSQLTISDKKIDVDNETKRIVAEMRSSDTMAQTKVKQLDSYINAIGLKLQHEKARYSD
jgi:hypothetical protein